MYESHNSIGFSIEKHWCIFYSKFIPFIFFLLAGTFLQCVCSKFAFWITLLLTFKQTINNKQKFLQKVYMKMKDVKDKNKNNAPFELPNNIQGFAQVFCCKTVNYLIIYLILIRFFSMTEEEIDKIVYNCIPPTALSHIYESMAIRVICNKFLLSQVNFS